MDDERFLKAPVVPPDNATMDKVADAIFYLRLSVDVLKSLLDDPRPDSEIWVHSVVRQIERMNEIIKKGV